MGELQAVTLIEIVGISSIIICFIYIRITLLGFKLTRLGILPYLSVRISEFIWVCLCTFVYRWDC